MEKRGWMLNQLESLQKSSLFQLISVLLRENKKTKLQKAFKDQSWNWWKIKPMKNRKMAFQLLQQQWRKWFSRTIRRLLRNNWKKIPMKCLRILNPNLLPSTTDLQLPTVNHHNSQRVSQTQPQLSNLNPPNQQRKS